MIDKRPLEIHVCAGVYDVVAAIRRARELAALIAILGGGHIVAGHCVGDRAMVVDLAANSSAVIANSRLLAITRHELPWV
jgi:FAD/FMN-containing dehydrogenase